MPLPPSPSDRAFSRAVVLEAVLALSGAALLLLLLLTLRPFLSPLLLGLAAAILLWPLHKHRTVQAVYLVLVLLLVLWLFHRAMGVLAPFIVAYLLAYAFAPVAGYLNDRFRVPRWLSAIVFVILILGLIALIGILLIPQVIGQLQQLSTDLVALISDVPAWIESSTWLDRLDKRGLVSTADLQEQLQSLLDDNVAALLERIPSVLRGALQSINTLLGLITLLAVVPVVLFYCVRDFHRINEAVIAYLPTYHGGRPYLERINEVVGDYLRGQLLISSIAALNVGFWLTLFDVPFSLILGALAGVLNLIPQIGAILTNVFASVVALAFGDPIWADLLVVQIVLLGQSLLESAVLTPNIMSQQVGLHPVLIIVALFVFGSLLGLVGFLVAVPATALLVTLLEAYRDTLRFDLARYGRSPVEEADGPS